jgi:membrane-bound ClpP family serine protease
VNVDIRLPIGGLFGTIGVILLLLGLCTLGNEEMYARSLGVNVNLWWGLVMLAFGLIMLYFSRRGAQKSP